MLKSISRYWKNSKLWAKISFTEYLRYLVTPKNRLVQFSIGEDLIWVRRGTPDLNVTISCLSGEFNILREYYPKDYSGIIVDAGGYIGTSSIALKKLFPEAKIYVIEPSNENIEVLKKNLESYEDVTVIQAALVGEESGPVEIKNRGTGEWGFTAVAEPKDNPDAKILHTVRSVTLQSLGVVISDIGILKLDIEGGEFDLFTHDMKGLDQIGAVFIELHDRIIPGCSDLFFKFSEKRTLIKSGGEKYLSLRQGVRETV